MAPDAEVLPGRPFGAAAADYDRVVRWADFPNVVADRIRRCLQHIPADKAAGPVSPDASEASA